MIDCHLHLWATDTSTPEKRAERAEQLRQEMELHGVEKIALIGEVGTTVEECREHNRTVAKYVEEHPDLFYGWARVDPGLGEDAVAEFRRAVMEDGLVGLKHHFYDGTPVNISDPEFFPLAEAAVEMDVPIIAHVMQRLERDKENWDDSEAYTEDVVELAERYPDLTLISAHIVAGGDPEYRIKNVADVENVILDISGSNCEAGVIEMAAEYIGVDRLVYGTDTWMQPGVGKLEGLDLTPEQRAEIAYNFETLLGENVPNRYSESELESLMTAARDHFAECDTPREEVIVDANAYVGNWPFRRLDASPEALVDRMDEKGVDRAVVSSFDAVFYRNCHHANEELATEIDGYEDRLIPFATINPTYTAWQADFREAVDDLGMQGVRLFPMYHDYDMNQPEVVELLDLAAELDVPVMIVGPIQDQRGRHPRFMLRGFEDGGTRAFTDDHVDDLIELLQASPDADVIVGNLWNKAPRVFEAVCTAQPAGVRLDNFVRSGRTLFVLDDLFCYFNQQAAELVEEVGVNHLVTGPRLPLHIFDAFYKYTETLPVSPEEKDRVRSENVLSLVE
ncbi:amidohydrolase family protein [Haloarchaeobius sp. TZWSO28]|uniref:amidohydrolase family protein n=1 Tax=Haloarchaeobius sp. TZWSO28 TaxID=3446119 RepID=UPI003EBC147C